MSKSVHPFADQGCYTSVHNSIFDVVMPSLKPTAWKILSAIIRATDGWNKTSEQLSFSKLKQLTGIKDSHTLISGLKQLREFLPDPLIEVIEAGKWEASSYVLNKKARLEWMAPSGKNPPVPSGKNPPVPSGKNPPVPSGKNPPLPNSYIETIETKEIILSAKPGAGKQKEAVSNNHRHPMAEVYREVMEYPALTRLQCDQIAAQVTDEGAWREILIYRNVSGWKGHGVQRALVEYERRMQGETLDQIYNGGLNGNGKQQTYETKGERNARHTLAIAERLAERRQRRILDAADSGDTEATGITLIRNER